jgi:nicotinamidase-related amidase
MGLPARGCEARARGLRRGAGLGASSGESEMMASPVVATPTSGSSTALVTVDLQYDFFDVRGHPNAGRLAKAICIPAVRQLAAHGRANGWKIVHLATKHLGHETLPLHLRRREAAPYCIAGTPGADIVEGLFDHSDIVVEKQHFDGFSNPDLARALQESESIIVTGIATDCCVLFTAHSASSLHSKEVYLPYQAVAASTLEDYAFSLRAAEKSIAAITDVRNLLSTTGPTPNLRAVPRLDPQHLTEQVSDWFREQLQYVDQTRAEVTTEMSVNEILRRLEKKLSSGTSLL